MSSYYTKTSGLGQRDLSAGSSMDLPEEGARIAPPSAEEQAAMDRSVGISRSQNAAGKLMALGGTLATPALAYHGYKRDDTVWGAVKWGLFGGLVWPITLPIAFAQGFAKRKVRRNRRRRSTRRARRTSRRTRRTSRNQ